ncbi:MAG: PAS domain S-box protein, partial [Desulfohalobiaceae bacterium]
MFPSDIPSDSGNQSEHISPEAAQDIVENAPIGIFYSSPEGRFLWVNQTFARLGGYETSQEMLDKITDISQQLYVFPGDRAEILRLLNSQGAVVEYECQIRHKDGSTIWVCLSVRSFWNDKGDLLYYQGFCNDITQRKESEQELNAAQKELSTILDNVPAMVWKKDVQGNYAYANKMFCDAVGVAKEDLQGRSDQGIHPLSIADKFRRDDRKVLSTGKPLLNIEEHYKDSAGQTAWSLTEKFPYFDNTGEVIGSLGFALDITELKQVEEELKYQHWRLENMVQGTQAGTWEWNVQTGETVFNDTWARMLGYSLEELSPSSIRTWESLTHPDDLKKAKSLLERHFRGDLPYYDCELRMQHKQGHWVWIQDRGQVVTRTEDGRPLLMFGTHLDISARKRAEQDLKTERAFLSTVLDNIQEAIVVCDQQGRLVRFNEAARRLHGVPEQPIPPEQWATYYDLYQPDGKTLLATHEIPLYRALQGEYFQDVEIMVASKHKGQRFFACNGQPLMEGGEIAGAVVTMFDVTARKQAEQQKEMRLRLISFASGHSLAELMTKALDEIELFLHSSISFFHFVELDQKTLSL